MNQSIQFPDRETFDKEKSCVIFPALVNGIIIDCYISFNRLRQMFGQELTLEQLKEVFAAHRLDIEDMAEMLIENQADHDEGYIVLD